MILSRRSGEAVRIQPKEDLDPMTPIGTLFADGAIEVVVTSIDAHHVKLGIRAHRGMLILREELSVRSPDQAKVAHSPR